MKLDYSIESPEERKAYVEKILEENPEPAPYYLDILADYLVLCMEKQERKDRKLLTENRLYTVNKRETSFEGLASQFENGEDGMYSLITEDKNQLFKPKIEITAQDLEEIPFLKQIKEAIAQWETKLKTLSGKDAYIAKKTIIDLRKDQYLVKDAYRKPLSAKFTPHSSPPICLDSSEAVVDGVAQYSGVSLLNPEICSLILRHYSKLREREGDFNSDTWFLMEDFDRVATIALEPYPLYERLVELKVDGVQNAEIQQQLQCEFGIKHSLEYISSLWRNKIPKLIASAAEDQFLTYWYTSVEAGQYKRCSKCGQIKLAHNKYFSKNITSRDGFYSICKCCRNKKRT